MGELAAQPVNLGVLTGAFDPLPFDQAEQVTLLRVEPSYLVTQGGFYRVGLIVERDHVSVVAQEAHFFPTVVVVFGGTRLTVQS